MAEAAARFTTRFAPTAAKPPPLTVNCTWPGPLPRLRVKSAGGQFDHAAVEHQIAAAGKAAELLSRKMLPETVVGPV